MKMTFQEIRIIATGPCIANQLRDVKQNIFEIYVTEYGTALTNILPILFLYLNNVIVTAGTFEP
jgi:hypothetical protein